VVGGLSLSAIAPDGTLRWSRPIGVFLDAETGVKTRGGAPIVGRDGAPYSFCETCAPLQPSGAPTESGIARFDPSTGEHTLLVSTPGSASGYGSSSFGHLGVDTEGRVHAQGSGDWGNALFIADPEGTGDVLDLGDRMFPGVIAPEGPLYIDQGKIVWGSVESAALDVFGLAEPGLAIGKFTSSGALDQQGEIVWDSPRVARILLIDAGFLVGWLPHDDWPETLVAVRADPVDGPARAPWPLLGHDAQNSGRAAQ
jgi:hypothetical protein